MSDEKLTVFTDFLKYLPKNMALLAQKLWRIFFCQNPFSAILGRKKKKKKKSIFHTKDAEGKRRGEHCHNLRGKREGGREGGGKG